ncbi:polyprenyl synthetase family protein [Salinispirillum marinum]|uniref:Polyprenyl synthetase family protein n=2 Tax=Saccharospirillaceae TaxID=255527 RepID=A0ABV8BJ64_9GAMM
MGSLPEELSNAGKQYAAFAQAYLSRHSASSQQLQAALNYAMQVGGKHVRPLLVMAAAQSVGCADDAWLVPATAVEMIHTYSLIHDDLPAMDDDEWRRGRPTMHIAFDEATAILAGDALQSMAFALLSDASLTQRSATHQLAWVHTLAKAAGQQGMVDGQALDLSAEGSTLTLAELEALHRRKTGCLIEAAVLMGGQCAPAQPSQEIVKALSRYAQSIGLAFQIIDDILDVTSDTETLGKDAGSDFANEKATYVSLLGIEEARKKAEALHAEALSALECLPSDTTALRALADFIVLRSR